MMNVANILSLTRLALLPFIILLFFVSAKWDWAAWACLVLFLIGAITDFLDGWVARTFNQVTAFGTFIDPVSDKIFVVTILLMLVATSRIEGVFVLCVILILMREFLVSGIREYLGPRGIKVPVTNLAKWKTAAQMAATALLILAPVALWAKIGGLVLLVAATILTVLTGWHYLKTSLPHIMK